MVPALRAAREIKQDTEVRAQHSVAPSEALTEVSYYYENQPVPARTQERQGEAVLQAF